MLGERRASRKIRTSKTFAVSQSTSNLLRDFDRSFMIARWEFIRHHAFRGQLWLNELQKIRGADAH